MTENSRGRPWAAWAVVAVWTVCFCLDLSLDVSGTLAGQGIHALNGQYYRLFSGLLLHSGFLHLAVNCMAMYWACQVLMPILGSGKLLLFALAAGCGAGQWLGFVFRPAARLMGIRAKGAGGVLLIGALGGFAPAAVAASEAVRTGQLTSRQASALLPACVCSGPSFVILTVGQQMLGSRAVGVRLFAAQLLAGYLTAALLCRMQGGAGQAPPAQGETIPLPALDAVIAQAAVTYLKLCGFVLYFRLLAAG